MAGEGRMRKVVGVTVLAVAALVALAPASSAASYYHSAGESRSVQGSFSAGATQGWFSAYVGEGAWGYGPTPNVDQDTHMNVCVGIRPSSSAPYRSGCTEGVVSIDPSLSTASVTALVPYSGGTVSVVVTAVATDTPQLGSGSRLPPSAAAWVSLHRKGTSVADVRAPGATFTGQVPVSISSHIWTDARVTP